MYPMSLSSKNKSYNLNYWIKQQGRKYVHEEEVEEVDAGGRIEVLLCGGDRRNKVLV